MNYKLKSYKKKTQNSHQKYGQHICHRYGERRTIANYSIEN